MALLTNKLQEILPLFPDALHGKITEVYQRIPGSFVKFLDPVLITKKVECREHDLSVNSSMLVEQRDDRIHTAHLSQSHTHYNDQRPDEYPVNLYVDPRRTNPSTPTYGHPPASEYNKYRNPLLTFLLQSIGEAFRGQNITDVPAKAVANEIVHHCFQQVPDWGRYQCQTTSTIVRFNIPFLKEERTQSVHTNAHVYAFLKFEYSESRLPWKGDKQPKISFEITIELNGVALKLNKVIETSELLSDKHHLSDVIQKIESTSAVTWNDLEDKDRAPTQPAKSGLTWNDL